MPETRTYMEKLLSKKRCKTYRAQTALAIAAVSVSPAGITIADGKKVYKRYRNSFQRIKTVHFAPFAKPRFALSAASQLCS